jgi:hypothetical protein
VGPPDRMGRFSCLRTRFLTTERRFGCALALPPRQAPRSYRNNPE